ncbi:MAG: 23S rRNA (guanosine(2251)-2'-O)-methyltransferase RlmB, partial [Bacteroidia bacterium]|nr:23S rRNA (guanosine(2251)-2'-O)-methyltransferase RlmB [Bacteroidia bacterium]
MEDEIIYGFRAIQEALVANLPIEKILIQKGLKSESWSDLRSEIQKRRIWMQSVLPEQMNRLLPQKKHQGIAAYISAVPIRKLSEVIRSIFQSGENP